MRTIREKIKSIDLERCIISCNIGKNALTEIKFKSTTINPNDLDGPNYAIFNLLSAIEDIAMYLKKLDLQLKEE